MVQCSLLDPAIYQKRMQVIAGPLGALAAEGYLHKAFQEANTAQADVRESERVSFGTYVVFTAEEQLQTTVEELAMEREDLQPLVA